MNLYDQRSSCDPPIADSKLIGQTHDPMTNSKNPTSDKHVDLQIAHLSMIQGVIARMSSFSAGVKNFCVTISAGIIAIAYQKHIPMMFAAAIAVVLIFFLMDGYYLALEKRYRQLYEEVALRPLGQASDMSLKAKELDLSTYFSAARSISVAGFYALLLIGVLTLLTIANNVEPEPAKTQSDSTGSPSGPSASRAEKSANVPSGSGTVESANGAAAQRTQPTSSATAASNARKPVQQQ